MLPKAVHTDVVSELSTIASLNYISVFPKP